MQNNFNIKDRIKYFQEKPNHIITFEKKPSFSKNSEKIDNGSSIKGQTFYKRTISDELQTFINEKPVFPCLLISKDDNGKIETNMSCLNDIDIDKIKAIKEDCFEIVKRKDIINTQMIDFSNYQFDISVIHNNANFVKNAKSIQNKRDEDNTIMGKYKLYSFNINEEDLSFKKNFIDKFNIIVNDNSSDEIKAKEIDKIFENFGYYIPLKIYIGGLFLNNYNKKTIGGLRASLIGLNKKMDLNEKLELKSKVELSSENEITQIFINENTKIIGGDKTEKDLEKWTKSVEIFNSNVIECTNIIEAKNILPNEIKQKLKIPLQLVEEKYLARKKYIQIIKSLKDIKIEDEIKGYDNISKGIFEERKIPFIYEKKISIFTEAPIMGYEKKVITESFNDLIVGFKIVDERKDGLNGEWKIYTNPLLQKEINCRFWSQWAREQKFSLYIYLIKFPE